MGEGWGLLDQYEGLVVVGKERSQEDRVEKQLRTGLSALNSDAQRYCYLEQGLPPL